MILCRFQIFRKKRIIAFAHIFAYISVYMVLFLALSGLHNLWNKMRRKKIGRLNEVATP